MAPAIATSTLAPNKRPKSRKSIAHLPSPYTTGIMDKENMTIDTSAIAAKANSKLAKRSRSRSLGPGGLDALQEETGNRRKSVAPPKSILKPVIPLSPLKEIPARKSAKQSQSPTRSPSRKSIPINTHGRAANEGGLPTIGAHATSPSRVQHASPQPAAYSGADPLDDELAAQEQRRKDKEEALKQRDARRKSMANRRVSFAPEATLHTWDMLEEIHDSTTSTNSTRRASEMSSAYDDNTSAQPENGDVLVAASPADGHAQQKKRRRRSSVIPPMNFNNPDDAYSSSPITGSSDAGDDAEAAEDSEDDTVTPDVFTAAQEDAIIAGHHNQDDAEDEDVSMEMANDEITAAFKPWAKQVMESAMESRHLLLPPEQENINPFSPAFKTGTAAAVYSPARSDDTGDDMSMDITRAIGGIVKQKPAGRRQSVRNRRRSSGASSAGGETMEFTTAIGGIQSQTAEVEEDSHADTNEDLSMEFTAVLGGIQGRQPAQQAPAEQGEVDDDDADMEMTTAIGGIIRQPTALSMIQEEATEVEMDMTTAIGGILPTSVETPTSAMPMVASAPSTNTPDIFTPRPTISGSKRKSIVASETGSPSISTRSPRTRAQAKHDSFLSTPSKTPATPSRRDAAKALRPVTPGKTPPTKSTALQREAEPKKLFQQEISAVEKTGFTPTGARTLRFDATAENTMANAYASMSPAKRRMSGLGFDKEGLGSPRVAALLDRRASIGEQAGTFTPSKAGARMIRFEDPKVMEAEIVREHQDEERRESAQYILEQEAEGDEEYDHTATLKEAIGNMTPKKTPQKKNLKGRKSLAPGGALGLLGKRPRELDDSDEDGTPRGQQGRESSPVKRIRLQAPPTKQETIGRLTNPALSFESVRASTPMAEVFENTLNATTPKHKGYFKDAELLPSAQKPVPTMGQQRISEADLAEEAEVVEKIHLQDFLNMTSIRFMELNTTKRRHTVMPSGDGKADQAEEETDPVKRFEDAVVAGACTIPMLELFQHSCRELKKYIAEGRGIIREIEADTLEDNPPLFREYMSAAPADRTVMDNQFKQMKTHARLLSKGMWYEWRMKLLDGLKEALNSTAAGMAEDNELLLKQEETFQAVLPLLLEKHTQLEQDCALLQERAAEFDSSTREELEDARNRIMEVDNEIAEKKRLIEQYKADVQAAETATYHAQQEKSECHQAVCDAQRVREELRGWSTSEVNTLRAKVDALEMKHGWRITSASGSTLTMTYLNSLQLFFHVTAFASLDSTTRPNSPISLTYIGDDATLHRRPRDLSTHSRFFLQFMRAHLQCLVQSSTSIPSLLSFVSTGWSKACALATEVQTLNFSARTICAIRGDEEMAVECMIMLPAVSTKVCVEFHIAAAVKNMRMLVKVQPRATVVYGEAYKQDRMTEFVRARVEGSIGVDGKVQWAQAVKELRGKLVAQGRKGEGRA